jgi:catechol 2,3-dioxygenase-like lactoylglutathione lyase family enzyme
VNRTSGVTCPKVVLSIAHRRRVVPVLLVAALVLAPPLLRATPAPIVARARPAAGVAVAVADAGRMADFYERVLFFERVSDHAWPGPGSGVRVVRMRLGHEMLDLVEDRAAGGSSHRIAIVVNDLDQAYLWLRRHRVPTETSAPREDWSPQTGGIQAVHFADPEGHPISIVQFPVGGGAGRRWRSSDRVFLGIDDTAAFDADP